MKHFYLLLIVVAGYLLLPSTTFACGMHKQSCNKETANQNIDSRCGNDSAKDQKGCSDKCGGKCGHPKCGCASAGGVFPINIFEFNGNSIAVIGARPKFYQAETILSSGFNSLWLIPKIG